MKELIRFVNLGVKPYEETLVLQRKLVEQLHSDNSSDDVVLLVEHPHVFTVGRKKDALQNVLNPGEIPVIEIERGGDVTYHGPGQLVIYPIMNLEAIHTHLDFYLRSLEDIVIRTLSKWGIKGTKVKGYTGVWIGDRKIASIGIAVKKWITFHGIALNVNTDLSYFSRIQPCGLNAEVMTSMQAITTREIPIDQVIYHLIKEFEQEFNRTASLIPAGDLTV
ncbi:MAG: lipoyl(octanoyl) transferase LipB [Bacteroidetes bacterium]|nr:lipoyl(octanoyl) transferase LipB [Bacteroidota bacterium]